MMSREEILRAIDKMLCDEGFEVRFYDNLCFDIFAKKTCASNEHLFFLKVLLNIDAIHEHQATDLKILSNALSSFSGIIGLHTRHEKMRDDIIYERLGISAFTPSAFENMVCNDIFPSKYRDRGGLFVEIDGKKMREARLRRGLTQKGLAQMVGISKKSVYSHEKKIIRMDLKDAKRVNRILDDDFMIRMSFDRPVHCECKNVPKTMEEREIVSIFRRMGFESSFLCKSPCDMIAKSDDVILTDIEKSGSSYKKKINELFSFSQMAEKPMLVVAKSTKFEEYQSIPIIEKKSLKRIKNKEELIEIIKKF